MAATDRTARHLELLTDTIAAVNSSLDLDVVFERIAAKVTSALEADACFVYLYDETDDVLELRATHDGRFGDPSHRPRMHLGEGITGTSAAEGRPVMIAEAAHLDARFVGFPNLPEDEYESILAVPVHARDRLEGALNVRTRLPRAFGEDEVALLTAIAGQVGQAIENAKLYEQTRARVSELESLAVQEIHHRVKNNLQTVASLLRLQARAIDDPAAERALDESVHRILSIAAVHDLLTTSHHDDVDCAGLIGRLEAMLGQGLGGREVVSRLQPVVLPGQRATAVALVFCELFQNALEHGRGRISVELVRDGGSIVMSVGDEGQGPPPGPRGGLGLTIAAALVREELRGRIDLRGKAVVRFPAVS
ncbi:MAG TPA: histidine kinase dimerization/phosphoacceptor domain -containing protein [Gaiellales bacterium]|jgi:two-component sensor histidine kinase/putative methionine-R-sulfoxide reductase with GAF domain|nr:histidine kinase dimerization/phosphoacceptor domain -containing protein [Gaiellales bacterium]